MAEQELSVNADQSAIQKALKKATGTEEPELQRQLVDQVVNTLWLPEGLSEEQKTARMRSAMSLLKGIKPADEIEGMLAAQMVATHHAAMQCLRRAMIAEQTLEGRDQNLKLAAKLLAIYANQISVLNKHRGKGQQKVTVEHVHVESGGQAMVGHIESGSSGKPIRTKGKSERPAIEDDAAEILELDLSTKKRRPVRKV